MQDVRLAIAGYGQIGAKHAAAIENAASCQLVAISDLDPDRETVAQEHDVPFYPEVGQMLADARPDGVIVAAQTQAHIEITTTCVENDTPCLVEKPFAVTARDARAVLELAEHRGVQLLTGHHRRHNRIVQRAREIVTGGDIGRLVGVSAIWALRKHDSYYDTPWRTQPGAGPVLTNLIHDVDSLRYICGEVSEVSATVSSAVRGHPVEDTAGVTLGFHDGAVGTILITDAGQSPWAWEVNSEENPEFPVMQANSMLFTGTAGALGFPRLELWRHPDPARADWGEAMTPRRILATGPDPLVTQAEHFARVIRGLEQPRVSGREGARTLACIEAVFNAAASGKSVSPDFTGL